MVELPAPTIPLPLPGSGGTAVVVPAPAPGQRRWAGAPSAALDDDGAVVLAYRLRDAHRDLAATVVARAADGIRPVTLCTLDKARFGAQSMQRPALVRTFTGRWRLYVCCATPGSKHWWIDMLEADDPAGLAQAPARTVFAGDRRVGVKDPVIRVTGGHWRAWICCHPLDEAGEEDRMTTGYATSDDGIRWTWRDTALRGTTGSWDARGARVTAILPGGWATYDGRATREENFSERTGLARLDAASGRMAATGDAPVADARYLDVLPLPGGGFRLYYEAPVPDGSHELRTELVPPTGGRRIGAEGQSRAGK